MVSHFSDFRRKEVVSVKNGMKIGYVDDIVFDTDTAAVQSVVVYGRPRLFGLLGRSPDLLIPWEEIQVVGEDIILVENEGVERPQKSRSVFDKLFS